MPQGPQLTNSNGDDEIAVCGDGSPYEDNDEDGLSDFDEGCYGTDPYEADTDQDLITDTLEVESFDCGGRTWTSDPFQPDSNRDGVPDAIEWPEPVGSAPGWDPDGDGVPNLWDDDNDGDGVPDQVDLSIYSVTHYVTETIFSSQGGGFDGYQYIEIQVQPQNLDHLRYSTTSLDWPDDHEGQIQDLDGSTEDLVLIPMLDVRTDDFPDEALQENYGLVTMEDEDGDEKRMLVPLNPQGPEGSLSDFYAKVAYGPGELDDNIHWESVKLVWMVQAQLDQYVRCVGESGSQCVETTPSVIQKYYDTFRVTGLHVTKSKGFELALFGTPESPTEDQPLFNLLFGISMTFLNYQKLENQSEDHTALQEIAYRFAQPNTPITYTWGVTTAVVSSRVLYDHHDEALATSSDVKTDFLETYYPSSIYETLCSDESGAKFECATVIFAFEAGLGVTGLDELGASTDVNVSLADVPLSTERGLQLSMFERVDGDWQTMSVARMMEVLEKRYADRWKEILEEELLPDYPYLHTVDLRFGLYLGYMTWNVGQTRTIEIDGTAIAEAAEPDETEMVEHVFGALELIVATPAYMLVVTELAAHVNHVRERWVERDIDLMDELIDYTDDESYVDWARGNINREYEPRLRRSKLKAIVLGIAFGALTAAQIGLAIATLVCNKKELEDSDKKCNEHALETATQVVGWMKVAATAYHVYVGIKALKAIKAAGGMKLLSVWKSAGVAGQVLAVIGLYLELALIWGQFLLIASSTSSGITRHLALVAAIVATIWALLMFTLMFIPVVNILVAIFDLVDLIVSLVFMGMGKHFSFTGVILKAIVDLFVDVRVLTRPGGVQFANMHTSLGNEEMGYVVGNTLTVTDTYEGKIRVTDPSYYWGHICFFFDKHLGEDPNTYAKFKGIAQPGVILEFRLIR